MLSASFIDNKIAWYENADGLGTFGAQQVITTNADGARSVYAADVDSDGGVDVLSASLVDGKIAWYENTDGQGTFGAQQVITTNADGARSVYAADVDGDGDIDVLSASDNDDKIAWYEKLYVPEASALTFGTGCGATAPLSLISAAPVLGQDWDMTVYGPLSATWVFFLGDQPIDPGIPVPASGTAGCAVYTTANIYADVQSTVGFTATLSIAVPNYAPLLGLSYAVQASSATPDGGFITSNGILATLGY